ncbi:ponA, partial [Acrasis kona]
MIDKLCDNVTIYEGIELILISVDNLNNTIAAITKEVNNANKNKAEPPSSIETLLDEAWSHYEPISNFKNVSSKCHQPLQDTLNKVRDLYYSSFKSS